MTRGNGGFTQADRDVQTQLLSKITGLEAKISKMDSAIGSMKTCLKTALQVIKTQNKTINTLHTNINITNYRIDSGNQYNRRESFDVIGTQGLGNDAEKIIEDIAKEIENSTKEAADNDVTKTPVHINLNIENDIQRCHFMGANNKKIICKLRSYKQRMKFMRNKKVINSKKTGKYKDVFIVEDLTPMRSRLVWFIKKEFGHKFCNVHTMNGTIRLKKSETDREWIHVNNPDDLFKHLDSQDEFNLERFNEGLHTFKILGQNILPNTDFLNEFLSDDEDHVESC